jgi:hypothetical protein
MWTRPNYVASSGATIRTEHRWGNQVHLVNALGKEALAAGSKRVLGQHPIPLGLKTRCGLEIDTDPAELTTLSHAHARHTLKSSAARCTRAPATQANARLANQQRGSKEQGENNREFFRHGRNPPVLFIQ